MNVYELINVLSFFSYLIPKRPINVPLPLTITLQLYGEAIRDDVNDYVLV